MNLQPIAETEQLSKRYFQDRVPLGGVAPNHGTILRELPLLEGGTMKSPVIKRSIIIDGHKTSITLEDAFWSGLKEIAHRHRCRSWSRKLTRPASRAISRQQSAY
jgi:Ribbon-helix-helix domain